jgi:hypothetical protein
VTQNIKSVENLLSKLQKHQTSQLSVSLGAYALVVLKKIKLKAMQEKLAQRYALLYQLK